MYPTICTFSSMFSVNNMALKPKNEFPYNVVLGLFNWLTKGYGFKVLLGNMFFPQSLDNLKTVHLILCFSKFN